jgi:hypothetical protein
VTSRELRRLEIDELLAHADVGESERVEAALELLRRRQAKQLRLRSNVRSQSSSAVEQPQARACGTVGMRDTPASGA